MIKIGSDSGNSLIGQIQEKQNNLFEKLAKPPWCRIEHRPRMTEHVIPTPAEVPEGEIETWMTRNQDGLEITVGLGPLNKGVSKENDSVSIFELESFGRLHQATFPPREKPQDDQYEKNPFLQDPILV